MSAKTSAEVVIDGKVYTLSGYEGEEYLQKVAAYINSKISEFDEIEEYRHIPVTTKNTLIQLDIADDYFKAKAQVEKLERDMENKEKEIYDLKLECNDLIFRVGINKMDLLGEPQPGRRFKGKIWMMGSVNFAEKTY